MPNHIRAPYMFKRIAFTSLLAMLPLAPASAQNTAYTMFEVNNQVLVELPNDWTIVDGDHRPRVADLAKKAGVPVISVNALSATSHQTDSAAVVRVTFLKLPRPVTQEQARANAQRDVQATALNWKSKEAEMWADLGKMGIKQVGQPSFASETLAGQQAIVIRYQRTNASDASNPKQTVNVTQNHIVLGAERALITFSYDEGNKQAQAQIERIRKSLVIK
ncbi:glycerate kinase [Pigmentiphaga aceris]|uniref:Glycerate kinase n=1 Tax=Pigmentiphaga aceris TaxID=1940612 RepID=A0A5C0ATM8_9BURK|nr:glycerate kinase [Pigmentiphaga aceris]QEI05682.1 glycerate kinase [Pigmentiphaga aceris]